MNNKNWIKKGCSESIKDYFMNNMGVDSLDEVNAWFKKSFDNDYRIDGLKHAVEIAKNFVNKTVCIFGDYDVDGFTSTSILLKGLKQYGFKNVSFDVPLRHTEGFGVNMRMVNNVLSQVSTPKDLLVITCDNGISQLEPINTLKRAGATIIIIDHHLPEIENDGTIIYPEADEIIDPNAIEMSADFNGYCGAGLCYRFISELFDNDKNITAPYLAYATLGTIADVMELKEENYVLVRNGLNVLRNPVATTQGVQALISALNMPTNFTAKDVAFSLAPTLNAVTRMQNIADGVEYNGAIDVINLLCFDGPAIEAKKEAEKFIALNELRKTATKETIGNIINEAEGIISDNNNIIIVNANTPYVGILGILAGKICEEFNRPAIVVTAFEGKFHGSARSCLDFNLKVALDKCCDLMETYGGHAEAAGVSLTAENFDVFKTTMEGLANMYFKNIEINSNSDLEYDLEISNDEVPAAIAELNKYEPFGNGNPMPIFKVTNYLPINKSIIGKEGKTLKLKSKKVDAIGFNMADVAPLLGDSIELLGTLSNNVFRGNITPQVQLIDAK